MGEIEVSINELSRRVEAIRGEVDALQVAAMKRDAPWYRSVSSIIAVLALLFSFGTTYVSYRHTRLHDIQNHRIELRSLLQRLAALPKDNLEIMKRYSDDPTSAEIVSAYINWENTLLAGQAAEIARRLPADQLSATEYRGIAGALYQSRNYQQASSFYQKAIETAESLDDETASMYGNAETLFSTGNPNAGRAEFLKALSIFDRRRGYDNITQASTNLLTELNWSYSEAANGFLDQAEKHVLNAERLAASLPPSLNQQQFSGRVSQAKSQLELKILQVNIGKSQADLRTTRATFSWNSIRVKVNDLLPNYSKIRSILTASRIPVSDTFGSTSVDPHVPKRFILYFGRNVPASNVQQLVDDLAPLGLEAISFSDEEIIAGMVYIGAYVYEGVRLTPQKIQQLRGLSAHTEAFVSIVRQGNGKLD